jgi:hypothetical protein
MSLQLAAQHLSSHGRGQDSTLVHMSPREVSSLNALAQAHGGHLTTNPHTGLPEAGFLEAILPMAIGALAGPAGLALGAETALGSAGTAALIGGGLTYAMTGSLSKGLMAGLGAYGGAGLGEGLLKSGTDAAVASAPEVAAAQQNAAAQMEKFYNPTTQVLDKGGLEAIQKASADTAAAQAAARTSAAPDFMSKLQAMGKGIGSLGESGGISNLYSNLGGSPMSLLKTVGSAAAPAISGVMTPKQQNQPSATDANMGQRYGFSMSPTSGQPQQAQTGQNPPGTPQTTTPFPTPDLYGREQRYFAPSYTKLTPEQAKSTYGYADGGVANEDQPTETPAVQMFKQMQAQRAAQPQAPQIDANAQFNQYAKQTLGAPNQLQAPPATDPTTVPTPNGFGYMYNPVAQKYTQVQGAPSVTSDSTGADFSIENRPVVGYTSTGEKIYGEQSGGFGGIGNIMRGHAAGGSISEQHMARGGSLHGALRPPPAFFQNGKYSFHPAKMYADGGASQDEYNLGGYSDGGRLLRGPGDGVSDSIPATIGYKQPARLADGEFVVPARIVSELGNGSTEAGARKLYAMMDRVQSARSKTVGKGKVAKNSRAEKYLPA